MYRLVTPTAKQMKEFGFETIVTLPRLFGVLP